MPKNGNVKCPECKQELLPEEIQVFLHTSYLTVCYWERSVSKIRGGVHVKIS